MSKASGNSQGKVLVIDDEHEVRLVLQDILASEELDVDLAETCEEALEILQEGEYDVVLADHFLGSGMTGVELCGQISERWPTLPTIILTAYGNLDVAISALKADAFDFLTKPCRADHLVQAVNSALETHRLREEVSRLKGKRAEPTEFGELLGESRTMRGVFQLLHRGADTDLSVLVSGETGTGKDLVAQSLHAEGPRRDAPFTVVHCHSVPEERLERQLFGVEGDAAGPRGAKEGLLRQADGGTLYLDEVGELPPAIQGRLLRVLQEHRARRYGVQRKPTADVRVIASTSTDLRARIAEGRFREDLYFRLNVMNIRMPPLRERGNDVLILAQRFVEEAARQEGKPVAGLSSEVAARLLSYSWPGNVRELRNCIERAVVLAEYEELRLNDLPEELQSSGAPNRLQVQEDPDDMPSLAEIEQEHIARVLTATRGNKQKSARILGVDRSTLYRKMARYGIVWEAPGKPS